MATYGFSSSASSETSPFNIAKPSSVVSGTYMVAWMHCDEGGAGSSMGISGGSTWNSLTSGLTGNTGYRLFWKLAGGSEPTNYSVTFDDTSAFAVAHIVTSNDAGTGAPVWQVTNTSGSGTTGPTPGITPPDATALEIRLIGASLAGSPGARTWSPPAGLTERTDLQQGTFASGSSATRTLASSSATTSLNFTASGSVSDRVGATVGVPSGSTLQTVTPSGIASAEAWGTTSVVSVIGPSGIASGEAWGSSVVTTPQPQTISPSAIASAEAFGTLVTGRYIGVSGIASGEAWGSARLAALIGPTGIASGEAWGSTNVAIEQFIRPAGLVSAEAFGSITLQLGYPQTIFVEGIESGELFEDPTVRNDHRLVLVNPSIQETPVALDRLNIRFGIHRGITIMKDGLGVWSTVRYPAQVEIEQAQRVYMGGHRHTISLDEAEELINAGYGAYILLEPDI